jgi:hypothetical protein
MTIRKLFELMTLLKSFLQTFGEIHQKKNTLIPDDFLSNFLVEDNIKLYNYETYFDIFIDLSERIKNFFELFCDLY